MDKIHDILTELVRSIEESTHTDEFDYIVRPTAEFKQSAIASAAKQINGRIEELEKALGMCNDAYKTTLVELQQERERAKELRTAIKSSIALIYSGGPTNVFELRDILEAALKEQETT